MSAYEYQPPIFRLRCDRPECTAEFQAGSGYSRRTDRTTRNRAREEGWDVPPPRGKGSRRGTDFCPEHAGEVAQP